MNKIQLCSDKVLERVVRITDLYGFGDGDGYEYGDGDGTNDLK